MTTISMKMFLAAGLAVAALAGGSATAEARGFGRGVFGHHGGFGYRGGFGYGRFGHRGRFYRHGYRYRFGGLGFGALAAGVLSADDDACRVIFSSVLGRYVRLCG